MLVTSFIHSIDIYRFITAITFLISLHAMHKRDFGWNRWKMCIKKSWGIWPIELSLEGIYESINTQNTENKSYTLTTILRVFIWAQYVEQSNKHFHFLLMLDFMICGKHQCCCTWLFRLTADGEIRKILLF